jgi:sulfofructose kinase
MRSVVCIGAVTLDLVIAIDGSLGDDDRRIADDAVLGSGGPAATAAVTLVRMGVPTAFVGTVGDDPSGQFARRLLEREGVDTSGLREVPGRTAMSAVLVNRSTAHRSIGAFYGSVGLPVLTDADLARCRAATWVHVDHVGFSALTSLRAAGVGTPVSVDAGNPIPSLSLDGIELYSPTESRLAERYPELDIVDAMRAALADGAGIVAVTRGAAGSVALAIPRVAAWPVAAPPIAPSPVAPAQAPALIAAHGFEVPIVSTLGAGDVFHGAMLAGLVRGLDLATALSVANAAAALSCRGLDGRSAIPSWDETIAFCVAHGVAVDLPDGSRHEEEP